MADRVVLEKIQKWRLGMDMPFLAARFAGADLRDADLRALYLRRADLRNADLRRADLSDTDLSEADLSKADLSEADLSGVVLHLAGLSEACIRGAAGLPEIEPYPIDEELEKFVGDGERLDMGHWYAWSEVDGSTRCRAGWTIILHPQGLSLDREYGTNVAAALIYNACSVLERVPDWYASNDEALADIGLCAEIARKNAKQQEKM
jgi:uncharacterized protein YjbI with pentapeptide repeats